MVEVVVVLVVITSYDYNKTGNLCEQKIKCFQIPRTGCPMCSLYLIT